MKTDCIFCQIAAGKAPAKVQGETKNVIAFDSIEPVSTHHILIVPKVHIETFMDLESKHKALLSEMVSLAQDLIKEKKITSGYRVLTNGGKFQVIPHVHLHLLGGKYKEELNVLNKT